MTMKKFALRAMTKNARRKEIRKQNRKARRDARKIYKHCKALAKSGACSHEIHKYDYVYPNTTIKYLKKWARIDETKNDIVTLSW